MTETPKRKRRLTTRQQMDAAKWLSELIIEQAGRCYYCGRRMIWEGRHDADKFDHPLRATFDHKTPLSRGGEHAKENGCGACRECNGAKRNKTIAEFRDGLHDH